MPLPEPSIEDYLSAYDAMADPKIAMPISDLDEAAVRAFGRIVDRTATLADLHAYRAWIVHHRMQGLSETDLRSAVAVADDMAAKLGVA